MCIFLMKRVIDGLDQGDKVTLCYKKFTGNKIDGTKEVEVESFEETAKLFEALGYEYHAYQENKRESYELNGVQIEIDLWPKIPPYIGIEGKTELVVQEIVKLLGFKMEDTCALNTRFIYDK